MGFRRKFSNEGDFFRGRLAVPVTKARGERGLRINERSSCIVGHMYFDYQGATLEIQ